VTQESIYIGGSLTNATPGPLSTFAIAIEWDDIRAISYVGLSPASANLEIMVSADSASGRTSALFIADMRLITTGSLRDTQI